MPMMSEKIAISWWTGEEDRAEDHEEAITETLCRLDRALGASGDDRQRAAIKMKIAAVLRRIGLHQEASYVVQEARELCPPMVTW
jgi:hypothetical protein